jgi:hypothetical protein
MQPRFYPEPPHVSLGFFVDALPDDEALESVYLSLLEQGGAPTGPLLVAPRSQGNFESVSDLADVLETEVIAAGAVGRQHLLERLGPASEARVLGVGLQLEPLGDGLVTFEPAEANEQHPVVALWAAEELGLPPALQSAAERRRARRRAGAVLDAFREVCEALDPLYAGIGCEMTLPSRSRLSPDRAQIGTEIFVSSRALSAARQLEGRLRQCFAAGAVETWASGLFCSGWEPFNREGRSVPSPLEVSRQILSLLGALRSRGRP